MPAAASLVRPTRRRLRAAGSVAVLLTGLALASCGTSGREMQAPEPGATAPPRKSSASTAATTPPPAIGLSVSSSAWAPGDAVPATFTCDGAGTSPPLTITGTGTAAEVVLVVTDSDAGGRVHWVVAGLDPGGASFPEGGVPQGAVVARNTAGTSAYEALCPPAGQSHTYEFAVHALAAPSGITASTPAAESERIVALAETSGAMTGSYTRKG